MKKKIVPIRDINIIEKELKDHKLGVIAFNDENEKINQLVTSYIYADKNIYIFFEEKEEAIEMLIPDKNVSFIIFKKEEKKDKTPHDSVKFLQIKCSGKIKKIEDVKIVEEVQKNHSLKYSVNVPEEAPAFMEQLFIIDTDEMQAVEIYD